MWRNILVLACLALTACSQGSTSANRGVYMLLDTSGTYTNEMQKAEQIISYVLTRLEPGDAFAVARVDTGSFSEKDIVAKVSFDDRPSAANQQKRVFQDKIGEFVKSVRSAPYTDISGGILQASEHLNEQGTGRRTILIFSDMKEDLADGYVRDIPFQLDGFDVVAVNVTKLRSDNIDPREYMDRIEDWKRRIESAGGTFRVVNDLDRLERILN